MQINTKKKQKKNCDSAVKKEVAVVIAVDMTHS